MLRITLQYSINKSKVLLGFVGQEWEQRVVSQLDSALNQWVDSVPDHRTFHSSPRVLALTRFNSALGSPPRGFCFLQAVGAPLRCVLPAADHDPSPVHTNPAKLCQPSCRRRLCLTYSLHKRRARMREGCAHAHISGESRRPRLTGAFKTSISAPARIGR
jgi:hypothetical protein